jgi:hypothetical protein
MKTKRLAVAGLSLSACAVVIAGCGSSPGSGASPSHDSKLSAAVMFQSPEQATVSWFYAINHKDQAAAVAHFTRAAAGQMDWGGGGTSTWPTFSALHCRPAVFQGSTSASVYCAFSESAASAAGNPDSFWTVLLQRQPDRRWLIDNYGQG